MRGVGLLILYEIIYHFISDVCQLTFKSTHIFPPCHDFAGHVHFLPLANIPLEQILIFLLQSCSTNKILLLQSCPLMKLSVSVTPTHQTKVTIPIIPNHFPETSTPKKFHINPHISRQAYLMQQIGASCLGSWKAC